jgi:D-alanyl-lipoteichoic acid acyltransferase DltB (MBOAT superfamily)
MLNVILPVGISFFSFHVLSYVIDLHRRQIQPTPRFADFALFVAFFPLLVAGPIERARHLIPQITGPRRLDAKMAREGGWLLFWGLWKKVFVAENLAPFVDSLFSRSATLSLAELYLAAFAFAFQIYCDFSGYTDLARGSAKLMGFELLANFRLPYFAANPADFWRRWHISLSSWLRDYLYIALGGNRKGKSTTFRNLFLTMAIGGLWHGAAWNFVLWGIYHGLLLIAYHAYSALARFTIPRWISIPIMFQFTLAGWVLFRANRTIPDGHRLADDSLGQIAELIGAFKRGFAVDSPLTAIAHPVLLYILPLFAVQLVKYLRDDEFWIFRQHWAVSAAIKAALVFMLIRFGVQAGGSFIYFRF